MYKIAVYTICKNELQFVNRWLESAKDADYMVVLDTGSTDGTYERLCELQEQYKNLIVKQQVVKPWRFDVARNVNLTYVPEDTDIFFQVDMDEIITTPNWANLIKQSWQDDTDQGEYKYTWSHTADGQPETIFRYNKIHGRGWHWVAPVHEMPMKEGDIKTVYIDGLMVEHFPDPSKSRNFYLPLLEQRVEEYPDDWYGKMYLAHEYFYQRQYTKSIQYCEFLLLEAEGHYAGIEKADLNCFIAKSYLAINDNNMACMYADRAIKESYAFRDGYLLKAEGLLNLQYFAEAIRVLDECAKKSIRLYSWLESPGAWSYKMWDLYAIAYFFSGNVVASLGSAVRAYEYNKADERLKGNVETILNQLK